MATGDLTAAPGPGPLAGPGEVRAFEHDYNTKARREVPVGHVSISDVGDKIVWVDVPELGDVRAVSGLGIDKDAVESLLHDVERDMVGYPGGLLRFDMTYVPFEEWKESRDLSLRRVRCLLGARFLITCHGGRSPLVESLVDGYVTDFWTTSKAAVFLIYEMFHHVLQSYGRIHHVMQDRLKTIDESVMRADESLIENALKLHTELLTFREIAHSSRNTLNYLASRASLFISVNTRPYLDNMSMVLERLDDDLSVDRQIISDNVSFYVSVVSYKMNTSIKAMTAVNVIFVPLTLLAAIYGMNFLSMPEYKWRYGYAFFWVLFFVTFAVSAVWLKRRG